MDGSMARAQVMPQKLAARPDTLVKIWPRIEAVSNHANVGWLLNTLASLKE